MEIKETSDYAMFKTIKGNRGIKQDHVEKLATSIDRENLLHLRPIIVNDRMEVIDGQHRLRAAQMLGVPIFYTVQKDLNYKQMAQLNAVQDNWKFSNFIVMYSSQGYPEYINLEKFLDQVPYLKGKFYRIITASFSAEGRAKFVTTFKNGEYKHILDENLWFLVNDKIGHFVELYNRHNFDKKSCGNAFVSSAKMVMAMFQFIEEYRSDVNWTFFFSNLERLIDTVVPKGTSEQYYDLFIRIYNFNKRTNRLNKED